MSKIDDVRNYTYRQIQFLIRQKETSVGKAMLANLRRGIGKTPGELPELWGAFLNEMPSELYGNWLFCKCWGRRKQRSFGKNQMRTAF